MVSVFKNVEERSVAKRYHSVSLFVVVSKMFEKLLNNRLIDRLESCCPFSDFYYGFQSSRLTADISHACERVYYAVLLH